MQDTRTAREVGERIEQLLAELLETSPEVADRAEQLVGLLMRMYGDAIGRMVASVDADRLREFASDPVVSGVLVLHQLHPADTLSRVEDALERVRPYLGSHAGGVELIGIGEDGVARLRLQGSCDGCPASTVTVEMTIEGAILEAAPEVVAVEVEGVEVEGVGGTDGDTQLLQIGRKPSATRPKWVTLEQSVPALGELKVHTIGDFDVVVAVTGDGVHAHRSDCPGCGTAMIDGQLVGTVLTCPGCGRRYDLAVAGRCLDDDAFLDPIPLLEEGGSVRLSLREAPATSADGATGRGALV